MKFQGMSNESKTVLSIFVNQLLEIIDRDDSDSNKVTEIREHITTFVDANDLHPEDVYTLSMDEIDSSLCNTS